jgi:tape measure domain-containing protein
MAVGGSVQYTVEVVNKFSTKLKRLKEGFDNATTAARRTKKQTRSLEDGLNELAGSVGIGVLTKQFFDLGMSLESNQQQLQVLIGDADKADKLFNDLSQLAIDTPYSPGALQQQAKNLLAFGVSADQVQTDLKLLAEVSQGNNQTLGSLGRAFGQIRAKGRLMGEELMQLTERGFNPLAFIAQKTTKDETELRKEMERGEISFNEVREALEMATSGGRRFDGMLAQLRDSGFGRINVIVGQTKFLFAQTAQSFLEAFSPVLERVIQLTKFLGKNKEVLGLVLSVLGPIAVAFAGYTIALRAATIAQTLFNVAANANPIFLIITGLAALTTALVYAYQEFDAVREVMDTVFSVIIRIKDAFGDLFTLFQEEDLLTAIEKTFNKISKLFLAFINTTLDPFVSAFRNIQEGNFLDAAKDVGRGLINLTPIGMGKSLLDVLDQNLSGDRDQTIAPGDDDTEGDGGINQTNRQTSGNNDILSTNEDKQSVSASSSVGNLTINIERFGTIEEINQNNVEDLDKFKETFQRMLVGVVNDAVRQI